MKTLTDINIPYGIEGKVIKEEKPLEVRIVEIINNYNGTKTVILTDGKLKAHFIVTNWDNEAIEFYIQYRQKKLKNWVKLIGK